MAFKLKSELSWLKKAGYVVSYEHGPNQVVVTNPETGASKKFNSHAQAKTFFKQLQRKARCQTSTITA